MIVHFPIGILFAAALVDIIGLFFREQPFWRRAAFMLYLMGGIAVGVTFLAGRAAGDSVFLPSEANGLLTEHADLGLYSLWFFGVYAVVRGVFFAMTLDKRPLFRLPLLAVALGGLFLLFETGEHGAQMVFQYGVGVQAVDQSPEIVLPMTGAASASGPVADDHGGWLWKPMRAADWKNSMTMLEGEDAFTSSMQDGGEHGDVLALTLDGGSTMFVFDDPLSTVQIDAALNLEEFDGTAMFVFGTKNAQNYYFMGVSEGSMRLGRSENGDLYLMEDEAFSPGGWHTYRVVGDKTHFRAYSNETLTAHGHGDDPGSGTVGLRLNGTGTVLLDYMKVQPVGAQAEEDHEHMDGEADEHEHMDGAADDHEHMDGEADDHEHADGTADDHDHADGGADDHDH